MNSPHTTGTGGAAGSFPPGVGEPGAALAGRRPILLGALLFLVVAGVFLPAVTHDFITYDDPVYVTENAHVTGGLTWENVKWALRSTEASNWHPLTWISHMADCQLYGLHPWGHHLTNVLLHALNALLLFMALRKMTGALWQSLLVAALFGLHPLHVESVAWISERKDVLSTLFWMLALLAYGARARRHGGWGLYGLTLLFFALGLTCKQMVITLPCVLLLLDYWPLRRWSGSTARARWAMVAEKIPFFALGAAASAVTLFAQSGGEAVATTDDFPLSVRVSNALLSYCRYLGKCLVPAKLAVFYPFFAEQPPIWETLLAVALLAAITAAAATLARQRPYLIVGWLWFAGTLVPVIGLVQIGGQSMADRYTYVPLIGVFMMAAWGAADAAACWRIGRTAVAIAAGSLLACLAILTSRQLGYWRDGASLFRHAVAVTQDNWVAHANLYATLSKSSSSEATAEFQETVRILAAFAESHVKKGDAMERIPGRLPDAIKEFRTAIRVMPDLAGPHLRLGAALANTPAHIAEAIDEFRAAVRLKPDFAEAHYDLGIALSGMPGGQAEAVAEYETVVTLEPGNFRAHYNLGFLLSRIPGRQDEAIAEYEEVIRLRPDNYQAHFNLGLTLMDVSGRQEDAVAQFEAALKLKPDLVRAREMIGRLRAAGW